MRADDDGQSPPHREMSRTILTLATGALILLSVAACGGDDGNGTSVGGQDGPTGQGRSSEPAPPGSEPEAVEPYVDELVRQYGELVSEIVVDPSVAQDPESPLIQDFLDLYVPDSESANNILEGWTEAGEGVSLQPFDEDEQTVTVSLLPASVATVSDDEVEFLICTEMQHIYQGEDGIVSEAAQDSRWLGEGTAARVDDDWRLESLDSFSIGPGCQGGSVSGEGGAEADEQGAGE